MSTPTKATARRVIELACRAPSVHNSQPWRWRVVDGSTIELHADRRRQLLVSDPSGRNLAVSCGAALHHSSVAARALGLVPVIELEPSDDDGLLARIHLSPGTQTDESGELLLALEDRCTDRRRFTSWPIPESRLAHLAQSAAGWGAHTFPITDVTARFRVEKLLKEAMAVQASDPRFGVEQLAWIDHSRVDGITMAQATPHAHGGPATHPNRFESAADARLTEEADAARLVESSESLMAICSATDDQRSWLEAGETLSALWLRATHEGLSVVPLSQIIEVDTTREALRQDVFDGMARPQILVRIGWLEATRGPLQRTPRRPVDEVIER